MGRQLYSKGLFGCSGRNAWRVFPVYEELDCLSESEKAGYQLKVFKIDSSAT